MNLNIILNKIRITKKRMSGNFEYLDIILLAMIAGFIILRLRGILGRRSGHEEKNYRDLYGKNVANKPSKEKVVSLNINIFLNGFYFNITY